MIENNNKAVIKKLAKESYKANKSRNKFAIASIALTTLLFTVLFTIGMSMLKSSEYSTMRMVGSTFHGAFKDITTEQYEKIKDNKLIKEQGITTVISVAENKELAKRAVEIRYGDENYIKNGFATPIKGKMPEKYNEVLVDTITLDLLGLPKEINQNINIKFTLEGREYDEDFIVSGIYEGDIVSMASSLYISKDYTKEVLADINQEEIKTKGGFEGLISLNVNFSNSLFLQDKFIKVIEESGYLPDGSEDSKDILQEIDYGVNWAYMGGNTVDLGAVGGCIGLILLIMLTGYLIIYNIFYISIVRDIKFYGLLKTIGTTKKQIKKIITNQALKLSCIGIPIGLILGYGLGIVLMPVVMSSLTIEYTKVSINPIIFIGSVLFSLVTVLISTNKPAKIASKVSPIEAVRYSGVDENPKKKFKKSSNGAKLRKMALANILKTKKKAFVVVLSLSLSIILLNAVYTMVSGFDIDKYLREVIGTDVTIGDASFYRWNFDANGQNSVSDELCNELEKIDGVGTIDKIYFRALQIPLNDSMKNNLSKIKDDGDENTKMFLDAVKGSNLISAMYYGIDEGIYDLLKNYVVEGTFDVEKFESGNYIIAEREWSDDSISKSKVGDKITIPFENGDSKEYEILAIVDYVPLYLRVGYSFGGFGGFVGYIPTDEFKKTTSNDSIMTAMFNVDDEKTINKAEDYLNSISSTNPTFDYRSKSTYVDEFESMVKSYEVVGYGLSFIVGVIGVLNFVNVMITSIITRRKELAMLKSIGMTQKQVKSMITLESMYYAIFTTIVVVVLGLPLTYFGVNMIAGGMMIFSYKFTMLPLVLALTILYCIVMIIPRICFKKVGKESIVEALREVE